MNWLKIPKCEGKECTLTSIDDIDFKKPAFYRVTVSYTNKNLCKLFQFSKDDTYTHTSINFYLPRNMPTLFKEGDIVLELIQDGNPNAYIFDEWFTGKEVFGNWYDVMSKLKQEHPKNKLIKWLTSALWGNLSGYNKEYVDDDDALINYDDDEYRLLNLEMFTDKDCNDIHIMINRENPGSKFVFLKPFLTSLARKYIADAMYKLDPTLKHIVRAYCDSVTFNKAMKIPNTKNYKLLYPEDKTTGTIYFGSRTSYYNYTTKEGHGKYKRSLPDPIS